MGIHCLSCTCELVEAEHSCEFCEVNYNHPKCSENVEVAAEECCPHCGSDPVDYTMHAEGCVTLDTCASVRPGLPPPWHSDSEWLGDERWTSARWRQHLAEAHPVATP